ncbi:MAG TPA: hypothetical protein VNA24_21180 [Hyalangium sp.]|nr:hypothetical protein [Hyalangium sp.]
MRATVFKASELNAYADRFQWVAVDISNPKNEDFLQRLPIESLPMVVVLDPERETLLARSIGAMPVTQLVEFLAQAERAFHQGLRETEGRIARAPALASAGAHVKAVEAYQQVLSQLTPDDPLRAGLVVSLIKSLVTTNRKGECMRLAARELPQLSRMSDRAQVLYTGVAVRWTSPGEGDRTRHPGADGGAAPQMVRPPRGERGACEECRGKGRARFPPDDRGHDSR